MKLYERLLSEEEIPAEGITPKELIRRTKEFEIFYNEEYPHSALGYKSPKEYYNEAAVYQKCV